MDFPIGKSVHPFSSCCTDWCSRSGILADCKGTRDTYAGDAVPSSDDGCLAAGAGHPLAISTGKPDLRHDIGRDN